MRNVLKPSILPCCRIK